MCEKCYQMRTTLLILTCHKPDVLKQLLSRESIETDAEAMVKASDTRVFRETLNAMLKNLPPNLPSFNVEKDVLLAHWSSSSMSVEPLIYVTQSRRFN